MPSDSLWTLNQVATRLGVSPRTVRRMVTKREIPYVRLLGVRFDPVQIEKWLEKKAVIPGYV